MSGLSFGVGRLTRAHRAFQPGLDIAIALCDLKGKASLLIYVLASPASSVAAWVACVIYASVSIMGQIPDRRIERTVDP
jgi:hypothetical protein